MDAEYLRTLHAAQHLLLPLNPHPLLLGFAGGWDMPMDKGQSGRAHVAADLGLVDLAGLGLISVLLLLIQLKWQLTVSRTGAASGQPASAMPGQAHGGQLDQGVS